MPVPVPLLRATAALLAACALSLPAATPSPAKTVTGDGSPVTNSAGVTFGVLSHRGGLLQWPENSMEAFTHSVEEGFDAIETDVLFTKDGHAVLNHYDKLTARCTHTGQSIHLMTLAQLAEVRCEDREGRKTVPIPTLVELAELLADHADVGLALDIKAYTGQPVSSRAAYATKALGIAEDHGLLGRTSIISFHWEATLPAIRKIAPELPVVALDYAKVDLDRVRLAAKLGANAFGLRMKDTSAYWARYVKAKGMDPTPWEVSGDEQLAFTIHYGGRRHLLSTDTPSKTQADLIAGRININPVPVATLTKLRSPVTISDTTYRANQRQYKQVLGKAVPTAAVAQLDTVTVAITVRGGRGKGSLYVGANSSPLSSSVRAALPRGTRTITLKAPLGDGGKLRIYTTATVRLTVKVLGYTRIRFA